MHAHMRVCVGACDASISQADDYTPMIFACAACWNLIEYPILLLVLHSAAAVKDAMLGRYVPPPFPPRPHLRVAVAAFGLVIAGGGSIHISRCEPSCWRFDYPHSRPVPLPGVSTCARRSSSTQLWGVLARPMPLAPLPAWTRVCMPRAWHKLTQYIPGNGQWQGLGLVWVVGNSRPVLPQRVASITSNMFNGHGGRRGDPEPRAAGSAI